MFQQEYLCECLCVWLCVRLCAVCLCVCLCVCVCLCLYAYVSMLGWRPEGSGFFLSHLPSCSLRHGLSPSPFEPGAHQLARLAGPRDPGILLSLRPSTGITGVYWHTQFLHGCWEPKLSSPAFIVNTSLAEPSL